MDSLKEFQQTLGYGEAALQQLKANKTPAHPSNYEFWYAYCAGFNKSLNEAVNELMLRKGSISAEEIGRLYRKFISPVRLQDRVEEVGAQVSGKIDEIMELLEGTLASTASYNRSLRDAREELTGSNDGDRIKKVVQSLMSVTREMETHNKTLETQLAESRRQIHDMQESLEAARFESLTDPLTALANRKHFDMALERFMRGASEQHRPLALLLGDIDHFKSFNDKHGHQTGDQVLRLVAAALRQVITDADLAARYGGEEFAILLPDTALRDALVVADQVRQAVMAKDLVKRSTGERLGRITMSLGVAILQPQDTPDSLIGRADACLYAAKAAGRNCVKSDDELRKVGSRREVA